MIGKLAILAAVCSLALGPGTAQAEEPLSLTLREAESVSLQNHPRITEADLLALASREQVTEVRSGFLPQMTFDATAVGAGSENTRIAAGGLNNSSIYERDAEGLTVTQMITDFGRTMHLLNSSLDYSRAAQANAEAAREELLLQVDVAFFTALKAQSILAVAHQTEDARKVVLDQVRALTQNKLRSELDLRFAEVDYEQAAVLVARAETDLAAAFDSLSTLLGDRQMRRYQLVEEPMTAAGTVEPSALADVALAQRPDLADLRLQRDASAQYAQAQKALSYPVIDAFGAAGVIPVRDESHFESRYEAAGVDLRLPIFDGGLRAAERTEAEYRADAAEEKLRDAENTAIHDVRVAGLNVNYAYQRLDLTQKLFVNASEAFDLAQARYKLGSSSIVELSQAQLNKTQADIDFTSAKYDFAIRHAELNFELGTTQ